MSIVDLTLTEVEDGIEVSMKPPTIAPLLANWRKHSTAITW